MELEKISDEKLINIAKLGNGESNSALGILYKRYYHALFNFSEKILGNKQEGEDNVNDVFCKFLSNLNLYEEKNNNNFKPWIFEATYNTAINKIRRKRTRNNFLERGILRFSCSIEEKFYKNENKNILKNELNKLKEKHSEIIHLRNFFDMDYDEIEKFLKIPSSTLRGRNRVAFNSLKKNLVKKYGEEQFFY